jgi:hypothetical protein
MYTLEVLAPEAVMQGELEGFGAARRAPSLAGKKVGLVWNAKRGGDIALDRAGEQLSRRFPDIEVTRYDGNFPCAPQLLEKALEECDVFVGSSGD